MLSSSSGSRSLGLRASSPFSPSAAGVLSLSMAGAPQLSVCVVAGVAQGSLAAGAAQSSVETPAPSAWASVVPASSALSSAPPSSPPQP